jgi:hypothetical protein
VGKPERQNGDRDHNKSATGQHLRKLGFLCRVVEIFQRGFTTFVVSKNHSEMIKENPTTFHPPAGIGSIVVLKDVPKNGNFKKLRTNF